jgi:uncharacterized protein
MRQSLKTERSVPFLFLTLCVMLLAMTAAAQRSEPMRKGIDYSPYPNPDSGYVTDIAGLLSRDEEERIEHVLWQVESNKKVEIIVVTINSIGDYPGVKAASIEEFARKLFDTYGIGNMPANNGVLLLVASGDRNARIELGAAYGHGRDADAQRIMDREILPHFRNGNYAKGISKGVEAIIRDFAGMRILRLWHTVATAAIVLTLILVAVSLFLTGKRGWGWVVVGIIVVILLALINIISTIIKNLPQGDSSGWGSGGMGGFGGGFSGGGGATGSW